MICDFRFQISDLIFIFKKNNEIKYKCLIIRELMTQNLNYKKLMKA